MQVLDTFSVYYGPEERRIGIYEGDLTDLGPDEAVDVLVVSAFPDDYAPTRGSLIGALHRKGVSVDELSRDKAEDLRSTHSCWLSQEIEGREPGIEFRRILCFEPRARGEPPEVVGDIFRSLVPLMTADPTLRSVAMPLVATGDQHVPVARMIHPLLEAAVHWMALGVPLVDLKVVVRERRMVDDLVREFARLKQEYELFALPPAPNAYDVFVSYSHEDTPDASIVVGELRRLRPSMRIFFDKDKRAIDHGAAWQQEVYEAIDSSERFLPLLSPNYLKSKICLEEFNIAVHRRRDTGVELLFPAYVRKADLPTYMRALTNYEDCREGDADKLRAHCQNVLA